MKDRLAPAIDAIVRVCDDIVRTIEERREEAAGLVKERPTAVRFLLPEIRQILKSYGEAQAKNAAERSAAESLVQKYHGIPGAYTDAETLPSKERKPNDEPDKFQTQRPSPADLHALGRIPHRHQIRRHIQ